MRGDERRKLRGVTEIRWDVGEVLDDVRVIALAQKGGSDPAAITRMVLDHGPAVGDGLAEAREAAILVGPVSRVIPADEVKELVAGREPHLPQALIRLDTGREPDLVAIWPVAATAPGVLPDERAAR